MARIIPYRGKLGKEHGHREFLQRSEIPPEYMLAHTSGNDEAIARDMRLDCLNQNGGQKASNIFNYMTEEEYFAMWDRIDTKGLFRNGELTLEAKTKCRMEYHCGESLEKQLEKEEDDFKKEKIQRHKQNLEEIHEIRKEEEEEKQRETEYLERIKQRLELREAMKRNRSAL